jgi:glycosyltransferase involved in cell wall biosynthesis
MTTFPFVSVIVPVWNEPEAIGRCLQSLSDQDYPKDRHEVIVVDNGSTDSTREVVLRFSFATLLTEPRPGSYQARNLGLRHAQGDYVAFTDADCVADPGWLRTAMAAAAQERGVGILAGRIELFRASPDGSDLCEKYERLFSFNQAANVASGMCVTANWVSPRLLLQQLDGFDGSLKSGGDAECARRIRAQGRPIVYVPEMLVRHPVRAEVGALIRKRRRVIGGRMAGESATRRPLSWLWTYFLISGAQLKRAMRTRDYSIIERARLGLLIVLLWLASSAEIVRIACGTEPRRA